MVPGSRGNEDENYHVWSQSLKNANINIGLVHDEKISPDEIKASSDTHKICGGHSVSNEV